MSSISKRKLKNEIIVTIALFLGIIFLVVVLTLAFKVYRGKKFSADSSEMNDLVSSKEKEWITATKDDATYDFQTQHFNANGEEITETDSKSKQNGNKREVYVSELAVKTLEVEARKKAKSMFQSSDMYVWLVLVMGVFYSIPALQLVLKYQAESMETGNQDLCYFNFQCS